MTGPRRLVGALGAPLLILALVVPAARTAPATQPATPAIELVGQTATVAPGGAFEVRLALPDAPADGQVELMLHGRVRSRTELAASMEGAGLRGQIYNVVIPIASLPAAADGARAITLSLDPDVAGSVALTTAGVYPLEIEVQDATGSALASTVTHVVVRPDATDESPPLAVAVVARLDARPARRADASVRLDERTRTGASGLARALAATPGVPATLAIRPETLEALLLEGGPDALALQEALRSAVPGRTVVALPYAAVSPDALADADLGGELDEHLERGRAVLAANLGVEPSGATWLAGADLGLPGLHELDRVGVRHVVVAADQVQPLRAGVLSLSLAQPFIIEADREPLVDAFALDPGVLDRLGTDDSPGLEVSRLVAELAMLWFEQPGIARGVVVPVDTAVRPAVVEALLAGLDSDGLFAATRLDDLFEAASPLRQPGGGRVDRVLRPEEPEGIRASVGRELRAARPLVASLGGLVGPADPTFAAAGAHLLLATADGLGTAARRAHVSAGRALVDGITGAITAPGRSSITLTAREGSVPLTLQNDTGVPVNVLVRLRSSRVEFPDGDTMAISLTEPTTRLNIPIRARTSGTFRLEMTVSAPDGVLTLARTDFSVQSTAVSGVGLVLSIGAAAFLLVWWGRHWRSRRSQKLVETAEPG